MSVKKPERKCSLTIGKKFTINSGNYSSIQPQISLTVTDIPFDKVTDARHAINTIVDNMFIGQVMNYLDDMDVIQRNKVEEVFGDLQDKQTKQAVEDAVNILNNM